MRKLFEVRHIVKHPSRFPLEVVKRTHYYGSLHDAEAYVKKAAPTEERRYPDEFLRFEITEFEACHP